MVILCLCACPSFIKIMTHMLICRNQFASLSPAIQYNRCMYRQLMTRLRRNFARISRRQLIEVGLAGAILLGVCLLVTFISPYKNTPDLTFYAASGTDNSSTLYRATVREVQSTQLMVEVHDGSLRGANITVPYEASRQNTPVNVGDAVLLENSPQATALNFYDRYRIPGLVILVSAFVLVVLLIGRRKGLRSVVALLASMMVIGYVLVPLIIAGFDAFWASIFSSIIIAILTVLISQGVTRRAGIILLSMGIILLLIALAAALIVPAMGLTGYVDDETMYIGSLDVQISLSGLVAGGIILASLGALDDIVMTQTATVAEIMKANRSLSPRRIFMKASRVGAEHIASLVNTLALVYAGAALPLIVIYAVNNSDAFTVLNSELIATEIVRTVIISIGLVVAVPVSTALSVKLFTKKS